MEKNLHAYNRAITLLKQKQWEEAERILLQLAKDYPTHAHTLFTLGLLEAATGRPYAALNRWKRVSAEAVPSVDKKREELQSTLPLYESILKNYENARRKAKTKEFSACMNVYKLIMEEGKRLPLPVEIYQGYFLSLLINGQAQTFLECYASSPFYVKNNTEVKAIHLRQQNIELQASNEDSRKKAFISKRWTRGAVSVAVVCLMVLAGFMIDSLRAEEKVLEPAVPVVKDMDTTGGETEGSGEANAVVDTETSEAAQQLEQLQKENEELKATNEEALRELEQIAQVSALVNHANIPLEQLEVTSARNLYDSGLTAYRNGDFTAAAEKLSQSLSYLPDSYFSDDASYFYSMSLLSLSRTEEAAAEMERFLNMDSEHYNESPYLDDVMLELAKIYFAVGEKQSAAGLVKKINDQFPAEWTAEAANSLLEEQ